VAEIVCVGCRKGFESEVNDDEEVTCPSCGHVQAASEPEGGEQAAADSSDEEDEALEFDMSEEPSEAEDDPALTETADFAQVSALLQSEGITASEEAASSDEPAEAAAEAAASSDEPAEEEDTRWRFRSGSGLVLFFPTYEVADKWAVKQNASDLSIARGSSDFRPYTDFQALLQTLGDPLLAIVADNATEAPEGEAEDATDASDGTDDSSGESPFSEAAPEATGVASEVSPPAPESEAQRSADARTTTMTSEFKFRTGQEVKVWPARILFLVVGVLLGGGLVYYAAWYGLLPGILY